MDTESSGLLVKLWALGVITYGQYEDIVVSAKIILIYCHKM